MEPYIFDDVEDVEMDIFPFPDLSKNPEIDGWELTEESWFVDHSGFGQPDEPALTIEQFRSSLRAYLFEYPDHGFAITGIGQFQLYVTACKRK